MVRKSNRTLETEVPRLFFWFHGFFLCSFFTFLGVTLFMRITLVLVFVRIGFSVSVIIMVSVMVPMQNFGLTQIMRFTTGVNPSGQGEKK